MSKISSLNNPPCEACITNESTKFVWVKGHGWRFACACLNDRADYSIGIDQFESNLPHGSQHTWRHQLRDKNWFNERDFDLMLARYYVERGRFNTHTAADVSFPALGQPIRKVGEFLHPTFKAGCDC